MKECNLDQLEELAFEGLNQRQACALLGISFSTFYYWMKIDARRNAWERGKRRYKEATAPPPTSLPKPRRTTTEMSDKPLHHLEGPKIVIMNALATGIKFRGQLREMTGLNYSTINDSLDELKVEGKVEEVYANLKSYYRIAGSHEQPPKLATTQLPPSGKAVPAKPHSGGPN